MTNELKWGVLVCLTIMALGVIVSETMHRMSIIEQQAPVVETCVKHPATVSPFRGSY